VAELNRWHLPKCRISIKADNLEAARKNDHARLKANLDPNVMEFIRPGVALKVFSAGVALDGTITVRLNLTDPKGLPLDRSLSCIERPIAERRIIIPLIRMEPSHHRQPHEEPRRRLQRLRISRRRESSFPRIRIRDIRPKTRLPVGQPAPVVSSSGGRLAGIGSRGAPKHPHARRRVRNRTRA